MSAPDGNPGTITPITQTGTGSTGVVGVPKAEPKPFTPFKFPPDPIPGKYSHQPDGTFRVNVAPELPKSKLEPTGRKLEQPTKPDQPVTMSTTEKPGKYGWSNEVEFLNHHLWWSFDDMHTNLNKIIFYPFSVKACRELARTTFANIKDRNPATKTSRFPAEGILIDMSHSVPAKLLQQIISALDFADRASEKDRKEPDSVTTKQFSNFDDAKTAFHNAAYSLRDLGQNQPIEKAHIYGIYTRDSFEKTHGLKWTEG